MGTLSERDLVDRKLSTTAGSINRVARRLRRVANPTLRCRFDAVRTLFISGDLRKRWRHRRTTWGFVGQDWVEGLHGNVFRVQLAVLAFSPCPEPQIEPAIGEARGIRGVVEGHNLQLEVQLFDDEQLFNPALEWTETKNGKPQVFRDYSPVPLRGTAGEPGDLPVNYDFKLWLIAQPPEKKPDPVYFEWSRRFFPGGLPSLGKRHS